MSSISVPRTGLKTGHGDVGDEVIGGTECRKARVRRRRGNQGEAGGRGGRGGRGGGGGPQWR